MLFNVYSTVYYLFMCSFCAGEVVKQVSAQGQATQALYVRVFIIIHI